MPSPIDPRIVAYAQGQLRSGVPSATVAGKVATRFPGLLPWEVDFAVRRGQYLLRQAASAASAPPGTQLGQQFADQAADYGNPQIDALVAFSVPGREPIFRTLRFNVAWTITIEEYFNQINALALVWITHGGPRPDTMPGGASAEIVDAFHRII